MTGISANILEILKYILPLVVCFIGCFYIISKFLVQDTQKKQLAILGENTKATMQNRLMAYERLAMLLERIHPTQLLSRLYHPQLTVSDLQIALIQGINSEFEYNMSQQIYVSKEAWQSVRSAKEQELGMVNQIGNSLPPEAPAVEMVKKINEFVTDQDTVSPSQVALEIINAEAKQILLQSMV